MAMSIGSVKSLIMSRGSECPGRSACLGGNDQIANDAWRG